MTPTETLQTYWMQATTNTLHTVKTCSVTRRTRYNHFLVHLTADEVAECRLCHKCTGAEVRAPTRASS